MEDDRRPVRARGSRWAGRLAGSLARAGVTPNAISAIGLGSSVLAGVALLVAGRALGEAAAMLYLAAAVLVQLRLLCNLLDGMVAVEGARGTASGPVWNELPDRVSDAVTLVCAGYAGLSASWGPALGWCAAVLAVLTAYIRALAGSLGLAQPFEGPMAKQQRMEVVTVACLMAAIESLAGWPHWAITIGLALIVVGSAATVVRRTVGVVRALSRS